MTTKIHINSIKNVLPEISSILEIQCGKAYEIENCLTLQDKNINYFGIDIVDKIIQENRQYFRHEKNKIFIALDSSNEPLPKADIVICDNFASHLPIANIWSLLENIKDSGAKYFAFEYYFNANNDHDSLAKSQEQERKINLSLPPFYFPEPEFFVSCESDKKLIAVYKISATSFYMDLSSLENARLKKDLVKKIESDIKKIELIFLSKENGKILFKEMMLAFVNEGLSSAEHNQKYYYDNPYKNIIDGAGILDLRNNIYRIVYNCEIKALNNSGYNLINPDNFLRASVIVKDYIRWRFDLPLLI